MANHKSAEKRSKQNEKKRLRNKIIKTKVKNHIKTVRTAENKESAKEALQKAQTVIDKATKKGMLHKKTAARKVSRLNLFVNKLSA